jgi:predicted MFS family arabinose efflux permease
MRHAHHQAPSPQAAAVTGDARPCSFSPIVADEPGPRDQPGTSPAGLLAVLAGCQFISITSLLVVLTLLGQIGTSLRESRSSLGWLLIAGALVGAIGNGLFPAIGSLLGQRRVLAGSMCFLAAGSAISALAPDAGVLLFGRIISSFGLASIVVSVAIVRELYSGPAFYRAIGLLAAIDGPANAAGFALGGIVQEVLHVDWRAVFWVIAAISALMAAAAAAVVPGVRQRAAERVDLPGGLLLAGALVVLLLPVTDGGPWGWTSGRVIGLLLGGVLLLAVWIGVELRTRQPMIQLRVFSRPGVTSGCLLFALLGGTLTVINVTVPAFLEAPHAASGFGASVLRAGLSMVPFAATMTPAAYVSSRLLRRYGPRLVVASCLAIEVVALALLAGLHHDAAEVVLLAALFGAGHGGLLASVYALVVRGAHADEAGTSAGLGGVGSSVAGAVMAAVITALLTRTHVLVDRVPVPSSGGYVHAWLLGAGLAAAGMAIVLAAKEHTER